jgi:ABC-type sugar transport system permease subunit
MYLVPAVLSPLVIGLYWQYALGDYGPISQVFAAFDLHWPGSGVLANPTSATVAVLIAVVWAFFGFGTVVFQSAMADISPDILDAAKLDGPSWLQLQRYIIMPEILPVAVFWFIVLLIAAFSSVLIIVSGFTGGGPGFATKPLELYLVNDIFSQGVYGYAAALGIILLIGVTSVVLLMLSLMLRLEADFKS